MHWDTDDIHTIHCFGDSLTAGYGAVPGAGWVEVVAKRHPEINWYNHASLGAFTHDWHPAACDEGEHLERMAERSRL